MIASNSLFGLAVEAESALQNVVDVEQEDDLDDMTTGEAFATTEGAKKTVASITWRCGGHSC